MVIICRNIALDIYKNRLYLNQNSNSLDFEIDEDDNDAREALRSVVPTFKRPEEINQGVK